MRIEGRVGVGAASLVGHRIAGHLARVARSAGVVPAVPLRKDGVAHVRRPALVIGVGHTGIEVTVVDEDAVVGDEGRIVIAGLVLNSLGVGPAWCIGADSPLEARVADMDGGHDVGLVEISRGSITIDAGIWTIQWWVLWVEEE